MIDPSFARDIVCMFAPRAAAELLRIQSRKEVDAANESLQRFFSDFPGWVYGYTWSAKGEDREIVFSNGRAADLIGPNNYEMLHRDAALFDALIHPKRRSPREIDLPRSTQNSEQLRLGVPGAARRRQLSLGASDRMFPIERRPENL